MSSSGPDSRQFRHLQQVFPNLGDFIVDRNSSLGDAQITEIGENSLLIGIDEQRGWRFARYLGKLFVPNERVGQPVEVDEGLELETIKEIEHRDGIRSLYKDSYRVRSGHLEWSGSGPQDSTSLSFVGEVNQSIAKFSDLVNGHLVTDVPIPSDSRFETLRREGSLDRQQFVIDRYFRGSAEEVYIGRRVVSSVVEAVISAKGASDISLIGEFKPSEYERHLGDEAVLENGFRLGGANTSDVLRGLDNIGGVSINQLTERMRPGHSSGAGFLGPEDELIDTLVGDNETVLDHQLTHQTLAAVLALPEHMHNNGYFLNDSRVVCVVAGTPVKVEKTSWMGWQQSPFTPDGEIDFSDRGTYTDTDYSMTNLRTGEVLSYSGLIPYMVHRYGFYEGQGTHYRLDPQKVIDFFGDQNLKAVQHSL